MTINIETVKAVLDAVNAGYVDFRAQVCRLEPGELNGEQVRLAGVVLDRETLDQALAALAEKLPGVTVDASAVRLLRGAKPDLRAVATNMTHLHREPSWLAELLSQIFNGSALEVLEERERWCFVRQSDGYLGWAYKGYLEAADVPAPTHVVSEPVSGLHAEPGGISPLVGKVFGGMLLCPGEVHGGWARLDLVGGVSGWLPASHLRELAGLPQDAHLLRAQMVSDARRWTGTPYLWGGCCANGIDCSGLAQMAHRLVGIAIPRDADQQCEAGRAVDEPFSPGDLLFFGEPGDRRAVTHVGISLGGWDIIHSSRSRNGVYTDNVQQVAHLRESFVAARAFFAE